MHNKIQIAMPKPCHENWLEMSPEDKGRFCGSCQKKVYDFTASSDKTIVTVLNREPNTCGRFNVSQLNRDLEIPKQKSTIWIAASAAVAAFLTLGTTTAVAQTPVPTEQQGPRPNYMLGKYIARPALVNGMVTEASGYPLPYVKVAIKGTERVVSTDADGKFKIDAPIGTVLVFNLIGYEEQELTVGRAQTFTIILKEGAEELMGDIEIVKNRTFAGRIFHSIGNIFR